MAYGCVYWSHWHSLTFDHRVRSLMMAKTMSNIFGIPMIVNWRDDWGCPGSFADSIAPINTGLRHPISLNFKDNPLSSQLHPRSLHARLVSMGVLDPETYGWPTVLGLYSQACINQLDAHVDVATAVAAALDTWTNLDATTGVHLDDVAGATNMIVKMNEILVGDPTRRFFVSTWKADARDALIAEFGDKVLHHGWAFEEQTPVGPLPENVKYMTCQEMTQDLFTLKECTDILTSRRSSMGGMAARMGSINVVDYVAV